MLKLKQEPALEEKIALLLICPRGHCTLYNITSVAANGRHLGDLSSWITNYVVDMASESVFPGGLFSSCTIHVSGSMLRIFLYHIFLISKFRSVIVVQQIILLEMLCK